MIKINDKEFEIKVGYSAIVKFESETGKSIADLGKDPKISEVLKFYFCAIKAKDNKVTFEEFLDALDDDPTLMAEMQEEFTKTMNSFAAIGEEAKK